MTEKKSPITDADQAYFDEVCKMVGRAKQLQISAGISGKLPDSAQEYYVRTENLPSV